MSSVIKRNYISKIKLVNALSSISNISRYNKAEILFWIFLDSKRLSDYKKFLESIPINERVGIVLRVKKTRSNYTFSKCIKKICKKKKFKLLIADNLNLANSIAADGVHFSKNIQYSRTLKKKLISCSCHGYKDQRRIINLNAKLVFISPIYITKSDISKKPLGLIRISLLANYINKQYSVLGGVNKNNITSLRNRGINSVAGLEYLSSLSY